MTTEAVGGVWDLALDLARGLCDGGVEVVLAAMGGPLTAVQRLDAAGIESLTLFDRPFQLEWTDDRWEDFEAASAWLLELEAAYAPEVVHVHGYALAGLPFAAPVVVTAPRCMASWFRAVRGQPLPSAWHPYEQRVKRGLAAARLIVAPTRAAAVDLLSAYAPVAPVMVIPIGRDTSGFAAAAVKEPFVLTSSGVTDEASNLAAVVAAAPRLPWPVYVARRRRRAD